MVVFSFLLVFWGMIYFDQHSGWCSPVVYKLYRSYEEVADHNPRREGPDVMNGRRVFNDICSQCHGPEGTGKPGQAPPLAGSEWVNAPGINRLARIPILGLREPIDVRGVQYDLPSGMTAVATTRDMMSDKNLGDVLSYIRQAWGNKASEVTAQQIAAVRAELGNRTAQATVNELKELPEGK
jgi:mono/diheme cytochrome c family protein